jgi:hypothetical protein
MIDKIENFNENKSLDLFELIELMFNNKPDKRKKLEYTEWKNNINSWINKCNKLCKFKVYDNQK